MRSFPPFSLINYKARRGFAVPHHATCKMAVLPTELTVSFCAFGEEDDEQLAGEPHAAERDRRKNVKI